MADVTLTIGDRRHTVACRDGGEPRLHDLATLLDARWQDAERASGGRSSERTMLFVALMLADSLDEAERRPLPPPPPEPAATSADTPALERVAQTLEALADALEKSAAHA